MMLLLTLLTAALAYPYNPYYQPYILGAPLAVTAPGATGATGTPGATGRTPGRPAGGMGMFGFPFGGLQSFLSTFFPAFASNPQQLFMLDSAMDGDIAEASQKYMQGDLSEAMDKIYDSSDLLPFMTFGRQALSGLTGRTPGAPGATGRTAGATSGRTAGAQQGAMNPLIWSLIDLQKPRPVSPVLSSPRTYIQPVVYPNGAVEYYPVSPVNSRLQQMA